MGCRETCLICDAETRFENDKGMLEKHFSIWYPGTEVRVHHLSRRSRFSEEWLGSAAVDLRLSRCLSMILLLMCSAWVTAHASTWCEQHPPGPYLGMGSAEIF